MTHKNSPGNLAVLSAMLMAAYNAHDLAAALQHAKKITQLTPQDANAHMNVASILTSMRRHDEAAAAAAMASRLAPGDANIGYKRAHTELARGNWGPGWRFLEARFQIPDIRRFAFAHQPPAPWQGQSLAGRRILLRWEEGFGDTIQMLRYVPRLIQSGAEVILDVQRPLTALAGTLATVISTLEGEAVNAPAADFWAPLFSLPRLCGEDLSEKAAPYLAAPDDVIDTWRRRLDGMPRPIIAVQWRGADHHPRNHIRSIECGRLFGALEGLPGTVVSVQIDRHPEEQLPDGVLDPKPDFIETAALMAVCDAVVTVDTAMAHLAGAVGAMTHVLISHDADWRWLSPQAATWYARAELHHQTRPDDWSGPLAKVRKALAASA